MRRMRIDDKKSMMGPVKGGGVQSSDLFESAGAGSTPRLDVVKLEYLGSESVSWRELFDGFESIKAITFSSGVEFVYRLLEMFADAEIIFGCEAVMKYTMQEIMAYQSKLIDRIRKGDSAAKQHLIVRVERGDVRLFVARTKLSHEKVYLLRAADGRKRVVMGSANLSFNAFGGRQRENICYIDGDAAYDRYLESYESLKRDCVDEITKRALTDADIADNIDALPISETVKVKKAIYIEPVKSADDDVRFVLDTCNLAKSIKPAIPETKADKKAGKILVSPEVIQKVRRQVVREQERERELRNEYPQLVVDVERESVMLNGAKLDLSPSVEEVRTDVDLFMRYMDGYSRFHGDFVGMQQRYYEFANWFFCSPFMAVMRDTAIRYDQKTLPYPVFGLVYGQSKAGKTSFLETLLKMMIGQKTKIGAPEFTRTTIDGLRHQVQGAPIIVDDLTNTRFNQHAIETIKNDDFGSLEHLVNYPAVVISANEDVKAVAQEVIRRTVICRVQAGLTNTEVMKSNVVRSVQQKIGTAFYREYLRQMLIVVPELMDQLKDDSPESESPDILAASSRIIRNIIAGHVEEFPPYVADLSLENYFSEQVTGKYAIQTIQTAWRSNQKAFEVNERANVVRYEAGENWDADRLMKELPETLCAKRSRDSVIMDLDAARQFFGIDFKRPTLFSRVFGRR